MTPIRPRSENPALEVENFAYHTPKKIKETPRHRNPARINHVVSCICFIFAVKMNIPETSVRNTRQRPAYTIIDSP
jgi:hypothetical protein